MSIRRNKAAADRLAAEALAERSARRAHSARALAILRERVSSPGGLAVCFGAGFLTGFRTGRRAGDADDEEDGGPVHGLLHGPAGRLAARLAAAAIIRGVMQPPTAATGPEAMEPAAGDPGPADF